MAPDCGVNITGRAINTAQQFFVTYGITFTFLFLCLVPFWVQLVTGCDNLRGPLLVKMFLESLKLNVLHIIFLTDWSYVNVH